MIWPCLRLVKEHWASLDEMSDGDRLSIDDVALANATLDAWEDAQILADKRRK